MKTALLLAFLLPCICVSQTGPAGIGTVNGASSLKIWLTANDLDGDGNTANNPPNNSLVSSWIDKSGSAINYTSAAPQRPTYKTGTYNSVFFNGLSPSYFGMVTAAPGSAPGFQGGSIFLVTKALNYNGRSTSFFDDGISSLRIAQFENTNVQGYTRYGAADYNSTLATVYGANSIYSWHKVSTGAAATTVNMRLNNGASTITTGAATDALPYQRIGGRVTGTDEASGDYYEIVAFNTKLNDAQLYIMENYLSAKYGSMAIQYNIYDEDNPGNGNFDFDVAGIGRVNATNQHIDAQGPGIVRMRNPTNLGDNEYLIWGHDNGALTATNTTDVPFGFTSRLARKWRVSEANTSGNTVDVGAVDISFNLTTLGAVSTDELWLLVDRNNNNNFTDDVPIKGATALGGGVFQFAGVTAIANNLRFTVGFAPAGLPIELLSFEASVKSDGTVGLVWETAKEENNEVFTIQRSADGHDWETVTTVAGSNNSATNVKYATVDRQPLTGSSFYRLMQTDYDGTYSFSSIKTVRFETGNRDAALVFPNPATHQITVEGNALELSTLRVINATGQEVDHLVRRSNRSGDVLQLDIRRLPNGRYLLVTASGTTSFYKQ